MRTRWLLTTVWTLTLIAPALADDAPRHGPWGLELVPGTAAPPLPGQVLEAPEIPAQVGLWIPWTGPADGRPNPHFDALSPGSLMSSPASLTLITLSAQIDRAAERPLRWEEARLELPDGSALALDRAGKPDRVSGRSDRELLRTFSDPRPVVVHYALYFPPLPARADAFTLTIPQADPQAPAWRLGFFRWEERLARAEAALAAWRAHVARPEVQMASATQVYTRCDGARDLLACGEVVAVPVLLRELARGGHDREAVPHFALLEVLAHTDWGRAQASPASGTPEDVQAIVARWQAAGAPTAPGVTPPAR